MLKFCRRINRVFKERAAVLIEAMLCVMILAVCLVPVVQALLSGMHASSEVNHYSRAVLAGENAMTALLQKVSYVGTNTDKEEIYKDTGYRVLLSTPAMNKIDDGIDMQEVALNIQWPAGEKKREMTLTTWLRGQANNAEGKGDAR